MDYIILAVIAAIMGFTIYRFIKRQKNGGGCDCCSSDCKSSSECSGNKQ